MMASETKESLKTHVHQIILSGTKPLKVKNDTVTKHVIYTQICAIKVAACYSKS